MSGYAEAKRLLDYAGAAIGLILLAPVMACLGFLIRLNMGTPVFFVQPRLGEKGVPFRLVKFRTMAECRDRLGRMMPDQFRLTKLGRILRAVSLDELPELWNVLRGEMSLVGPRPLLVRYLNRYTPEQARRHTVPPGLTGWVQVNGRNALTWEKKFELDLWYVSHRSLRLDMKIILMTFHKVIRREGVRHEGEATMMEFFPRMRGDAKHIETAGIS